MKDLLKIMLILALIFASTFIVFKLSGVLTLEDIQALLFEVQQLDPALLAVVVIILLLGDLFVAIPTMTVSIMAGYFLGWPMGFVATSTGLFLAGITGYGISRLYGWRLLKHIYKDQERLDEIHQAFLIYGPIMLIICRAVPILPEVSCCMAGATRMSFYKFLGMFTLGTVPYALITTYAGSISTLNNPTPALAVAIGLSLTLWMAWYLLGRRLRRANSVQ